MAELRRGVDNVVPSRTAERGIGSTKAVKAKALVDVACAALWRARIAPSELWERVRRCPASIGDQGREGLRRSRRLPRGRAALLPQYGGQARLSVAVKRREGSSPMGRSLRRSPGDAEALRERASQLVASCRHRDRLPPLTARLSPTASYGPAFGNDARAAREDADRELGQIRAQLRLLAETNEELGQRLGELLGLRQPQRPPM